MLSLPSQEGCIEKHNIYNSQLLLYSIFNISLVQVQLILNWEISSTLTLVEKMLIIKKLQGLTIWHAFETYCVTGIQWIVCINMFL